MIKVISTICLAFMLIACSNSSNIYGEDFESGTPISTAELVKTISTNNSVEGVVVEGTVVDACKVKGCWLTLNSGEDQIRVSFRDYGFFVPKNIAGKTVVMKGDGKKEITSVADLQHYAEDEGQSAEEIAKITEPLEEFVFVADGVKIK